jgi:glycerol-3-phosphate dehydrogenase subunit B
MTNKANGSDIIVIGAGWSGLSAAAFALERGAKVRLIAQGIGSVIVTPGWISVWDSQSDPFAAVESLIASKTHSDHPYVLAGNVREAVEAFCAFSEKIGLPYSVRQERTRGVPVALGGEQHPAAVPFGYAHAQSRPLVVGFEGWRDYYPALSGGHVATVRLPQSDRPWDATPTDLARAFDDPAYRAEVAREVIPQLRDVSANSVGFPAVLGLDDPITAIRDLEQRIGASVYEMPTLPPSVPGTRLFNKMRRYFLDNGVRVQVGHPVVHGIVEGGRVRGVEVAAAGKLQAFRADAVILAGGGLYGGGLFSDDRGRIWEPLFNLPVQYNADRTAWFNSELLDPNGHPVHRFGVKVDANMQAGLDGLHVIGHMLAQPEGDSINKLPAPHECSEGIAIATAYKAIQSALG